MNSLAFILLGLAVGAFSGMVGVGGGVVLIPALVYFFGFTQGMAQGTTTAMLVPPIGILAAWTYYKNGLVDLRAAGLICAGFVFGGLWGARFAVSLPKDDLRRIFGGILLLIGARMVIWK